MSSRAARRLEALGFREVYRYTARKSDWLSSGLYSEGEFAAELRIGAIANRDVATCLVGQHVGDLRANLDRCVVTNEERIVLGDLRGKTLRAHAETSVADVMNPAPSTYRPDVSVQEIAHHMLETGARKILVSDAEGRLIGSLTLDAVLHALDEH